MVFSFLTFVSCVKVYRIAFGRSFTLSRSSDGVAIGIEGLNEEAGFNLFSNSSSDFNGDVASDLPLNGSGDGANDLFCDGVGDLLNTASFVASPTDPGLD